NSLLRCCNPDLPPTVLAHAESDTAATRILSWPGETPDRTCTITLHLARAPTSRRPHCFLITALAISECNTVPAGSSVPPAGAQYVPSQVGSDWHETST
ncbi:MAG: hypothetical protein JNK25_13715, partial [Phycisphaerae bacterium]|nr:hypothetical protein [Phycisphaerae bacterium]